MQTVELHGMRFDCMDISGWLRSEDTRFLCSDRHTNDFFVDDDIVGGTTSLHRMFDESNISNRSLDIFLVEMSSLGALRMLLAGVVVFEFLEQITLGWNK